MWARNVMSPDPALGGWKRATTDVLEVESIWVTPLHPVTVCLRKKCQMANVEATTLHDASNYVSYIMKMTEGGAQNATKQDEERFRLRLHPGAGSFPVFHDRSNKNGPQPTPSMAKFGACNQFEVII